MVLACNRTDQFPAARPPEQRASRFMLAFLLHTGPGGGLAFVGKQKARLCDQNRANPQKPL
jgi:hypothetical protein